MIMITTFPSPTLARVPLCSARARVSRQPPATGALTPCRLVAPIETIYPWVRHERWWVHKLRNLFDDVRRRYHAGIKPDAQRVYLARDAG